MNKKLIATLVMSSVVASAFAVNAGAATDKVVLKDTNGKVHTVEKLGKVSGKSAEARAFAALNKAKDVYGFAQAEGQFKLRSSKKDDAGLTHTKMDRAFNGIPVFGSEMIVHELNGDVQGISGTFTNLEPTASKASLDPVSAIESAIDSLAFDGELSEKPTADLMYYPQNGKAVLSYKVSARYFADAPGNWVIFVNAVDGTIVDSWNAVHAGTGVGVLGDTKTINTTLVSGSYRLEDRTKYMYTQKGSTINTYTFNNGTTSQYYMTDTDDVYNATNQRAGVDAHYYAGQVYNYYYNSLGRNSYDGLGRSIISGVRYSTNYNNAFWNGSQMTYGDGDGVQFIALSGAYDVVAHELSHAVTEYESGLVYQNESGAMNESYSDVIAAVVDSADWLIGEDVYTPGTAGDALRSMSNPALYGHPDHYTKRYTGTADNGGVHSNSGIGNKAFYNFATAIGSRSIAGKIWYTANRDYWTSNATFSQARAGTLQATAALYGSTSSYYSALQTAWSNVGVY